MQNFIQIGLGVSVLRMRDFAPLGAPKVTRLFFLVLEKGYSRDACTDVIFGPHFDGTIFSPENGFNIGRLESKRPLIVVESQ